MKKLNKVSIVFFFLILFSLSVSGLNITSDVVIDPSTTNANYSVYGEVNNPESLTIGSGSIIVESSDANFTFFQTPSTQTNYEVIGMNFTAVNASNTSEAFSNFSIIDENGNTQSTTDGDTSIFAITGSRSYTCDVPGYALNTKTLSLTNLSTSYQFEIYTSNSINISIYDELGGTLISGQDVDISLISGTVSYNYTTNTGNLYIDGINPESYVIRYSAENYTTRFYTFELTNRTHVEFNLYLLEATSTDLVTVTVIDQESNALPNAIVKSLVFDVNSNTYVLQQSLNTDSNGEVVFSTRLGEDFYYFIVEYPAGTQLKQTSPSLLYSSTVLIQVQTQEPGGTSWAKTLNVNHNITWYNDTNEFTFRYNDAENTVSEGCIYVYDSRYNGKTLLGSLCGYGAANSLTVQVDGEEGSYYVAKGYVKLNGGFTLLTELQKVIPLGSIADYTSLFFVAILLLAFAMTAIKTGPAAVVLLPMVGLMGVRLLGLLSAYVTWGVVFSLSIVAIIIAVILKRRTGI